MSAPTVHTMQMLVLPAGVEPGTDDARYFGLTVRWCGPYAGRSGGGWAVEHLGDSLSRAGNWAWPDRFQRWQYRWETSEEAVEAALTVIDDVKVNGRTRAEWQAVRARKASR